MPTLTIELPQHQAQTAFNLRRWAELLVDPELARFEGRIETDRHGHIIMSPLPAPSHGSFQAEIAHLLRDLMPRGRVLTECPISTADGVKAADVAWASPECMKSLGKRVCFPTAPEVCVEVLSPSNTEAEIQEKMALYFDAGAREVWVCAESGAMIFYGAGSAKPMSASRQCPQFQGRLNCNSAPEHKRARAEPPFASQAINVPNQNEQERWAEQFACICLVEFPGFDVRFSRQTAHDGISEHAFPGPPVFHDGPGSSFAHHSVLRRGPSLSSATRPIAQHANRAPIATNSAAGDWSLLDTPNGSSRGFTVRAALRLPS